MKSLTLIVTLLSLSACATCERHPYVCATAGAIVVGSVAYTLEMNDSQHRQPAPNLSALHLCVHGGPFGSISVSCPQ